MPQLALRGRLWAAMLLGVLLLSLALRLFGVGWGIPDYDAALMPHTPYRHSYHIDEDNFLWGLMQMRPSEGNFDIVDYHWGSLHHYLLYGTLLLGSAVGVVPVPWESAFALGDVEALPRIYIVGRLLSVALGVACTAVVMALGVCLGGRRVGLAAGVGYAIAPFAVMEAHYLTNDVSMSALVAGSVLAGVWAARVGGLRFLMLAGLLMGLATASKYSAIFALPTLFMTQWQVARTRVNHDARSIITTVVTPWLAAVGGFLLGQPYALLKPGSLAEGLRMTSEGNAIQVSGLTFLKEGAKMLVWQVTNLGGLGLTWPFALLALAGLGLMAKWAVNVWMGRAGGGKDESTEQRNAGYAAAIILAAVCGLALGLMLNRVHVLRYSQPLLPFLAVAAGLAWGALPNRGLRWAAGGLAVVVAGWITWGQLSILTGPHTANSLQAWLHANLRPGQQVARLWPEYPVLDERRYRLIRLDPWRPELPPSARPDYIVLDDMQFGPPTEELAGLVSREYREVARFGVRPRVGPFEWDEGTTPHDWKYSHPTFIVYAPK